MSEADERMHVPGPDRRRGCLPPLITGLLAAAAFLLGVLGCG